MDPNKSSKEIQQSEKLCGYRALKKIKTIGVKTSKKKSSWTWGRRFEETNLPAVSDNEWHRNYGNADSYWSEQLVNGIRQHKCTCASCHLRLQR